VAKKLQVSESFQGLMDSLVITKDDIKLISNGDGSRTARYGVWILIRRWPSGHQTILMSTAPPLMLKCAEEALDDVVWGR
jgi:hypothetical protein